MSEEVKEKKVPSKEEFYSDYTDEQLQKLLITYITGDAGEQNPIAYDIQEELERRLKSGSKDKDSK